MPLFSVILPAYNASIFVDKAIASALSQTLTDLEVIVVDDGSSDDTARVVSQFGERDDRLKLIRLDENRGNAYARNAGLSLAKGEWIASLDADDWYAPERLSRILAAAESEPEVDIIADNRYQLYEDLGGLCEPHLPTDGPEVAFIRSGEVVRRFSIGGAGSLDSLYPVCRRSFLETHGLRYQDEMRVASDKHLLLRCLDKTAGMLVLREPGYYRLVRRNSVSYGASLETRRHSLGFLKELAAGPWNSQELQVAVQTHVGRMEDDLRMRSLGRPLKRGRLLKALSAALRDPAAVGLLVRHLVWRSSPAGSAR